MITSMILWDTSQSVKFSNLFQLNCRAENYLEGMVCMFSFFFSEKFQLRIINSALI